MEKERINAALSLDGLGDDARAAFDLAAQAGYGGVAIPTHHPQLKPEMLGSTAIRHVRQTLDSRYLHVAAIRVAAPRAGLGDPASIDRTVDNTRAAIRLAHQMGVTTVALNVGILEGATVDHATILSAAQALAAEADKAGVALAFSGNSVPKLEELLRELAFPRAKANLDPARAIADGEEPLRAAERLAGHLGQLTVADAIRAGRQSRMVELSQGQVPWEDLLGMIRELGFQGPTVVDVRDLGDAVHGAHQAAEVLRRMMAQRK